MAMATKTKTINVIIINEWWWSYFINLRLEFTFNKQDYHRMLFIVNESSTLKEVASFYAQTPKLWLSLYSKVITPIAFRIHQWHFTDPLSSFPASIRHQLSISGIADFYKWLLTKRNGFIHIVRVIDKCEVQDSFLNFKWLGQSCKVRLRGKGYFVFQ